MTTTATYTYEREVCEIEFPKPEPTIEEMIAGYDWDYDTALAVAKAESNLNPNAYNPEAHRGCSGSYSVMQVACIHYEKRGIYGEERFDPKVNIQIAYEIYSEQGWKPWGAYTNGSWLAYYDK